MVAFSFTFVLFVLTEKTVGCAKLISTKLRCGVVNENGLQDTDPKAAKSAKLLHLRTIQKKFFHQF